MVKRLQLFLALCLVLGSSRAYGDDPFNIAVKPEKLAFLLTQLYGPGGLIVDSLTVLPSGDTHSAHFNSDFQTGFTQFNTALASQIVNVPLPSPASGFTYEFDATLGVFTRTTQSFGPILAERWETIGGGRFSFGFTFHTIDVSPIASVNPKPSPPPLESSPFSSTALSRMGSSIKTPGPPPTTLKIAPVPCAA